MKRRILIILLSTLSTGVFAKPSVTPNVLGVWVCGPYRMEGPESVITSRDTYDFKEDGTFTEKAETNRKFRRISHELNTVIIFQGKWWVKEKILYIQTKTAKFISSDNPGYTLERGQSNINSAIQSKNLSKYELSSLGKTISLKLIDSSLSPINNMVISCSRA